MRTPGGATDVRNTIGENADVRSASQVRINHGVRYALRYTMESAGHEQALKESLAAQEEDPVAQERAPAVLAQK